MPAGRGRVAVLVAVGLAVATLLTAGPAHAQRAPIVPDLSGKLFSFFWNNQSDRIATGSLSINAVDIYTGNFGGFLQGSLATDAPRTGLVTGRIFPAGPYVFDITFTVASPTDLWTYVGRLEKPNTFWSAEGRFTHTDPRDPDFYDAGYWDAERGA